MNSTEANLDVNRSTPIYSIGTNFITQWKLQKLKHRTCIGSSTYPECQGYLISNVSNYTDVYFLNSTSDETIDLVGYLFVYGFRFSNEKKTFLILIIQENPYYNIINGKVSLYVCSAFTP
ncbi:unnamed protein product [Euphydryas editha]|uniref:Uncharacterized protein n=1 Tax=Euphydryas editha TaxID=104508 RepID=A0AAU9V6P9_EUPED|nr:unnamed protein product [Euphydryas editha]